MRFILSYFVNEESKYQSLAEQMELRAKELKSQEAMLQTKVGSWQPCVHETLLNPLKVSLCQAADLKSRRKKLEEEEEDGQTEVRHVHGEPGPRLCRKLGQLFKSNESRFHIFCCLQTLNQLRHERDLLKEELQRAMRESLGARELIHQAKEGTDMARKERDEAIEESLRAKLDKELLEKKLEHLEKKYKRLSRVRSGFGCGVRPSTRVDHLELNRH